MIRLPCNILQLLTFTKMLCVLKAQLSCHAYCFKTELFCILFTEIFTYFFLVCLLLYAFLLLFPTHSSFIPPTARPSISQPRAEFLIWKSLNLAYYCSARCCFLSLLSPLNYTQPPSRFSLKKPPMFKTKHEQKITYCFPRKITSEKYIKKLPGWNISNSKQSVNSVRRLVSASCKSGKFVTNLRQV